MIWLTREAVSRARRGTVAHQGHGWRRVNPDHAVASGALGAALPVDGASGTSYPSHVSGSPLPARTDPTVVVSVEPHVLGHGVSETEVEQVLDRPGEDRSGRDGSRVAIGQTRSGRYLRVIYVPDPVPDSVFVITAYELLGKALAAYRRRRRKKPSR